MADLALWENEELLEETKIGTAGRHGRAVGMISITNFRIVCRDINSFYEMPHNMITSFKWDKGFMKGGNFKITWFAGKQSMQVHYQVNNKRKISKTLEKMPYYDRPAVLLPWPEEAQDNPQTEQSDSKVATDDPLKILKARYAKGEITKEEFDKMRKDLE